MGNRFCQFSRIPNIKKEVTMPSIRKSEGQFAGFKDHIVDLNPDLYAVIRDERTFIEAIQAVPLDMAEILETEFQKYIGE